MGDYSRYQRNAPGHHLRTVVLILEDRCVNNLYPIDLWGWRLPFCHLRVRPEVEDVGDPECFELRFAWLVGVSFIRIMGAIRRIPSPVMPETSPDLYINEGFVMRLGSAVW